MNAHNDHASMPTVASLDGVNGDYVDKQAFRDAMASFGTTACLVTVRVGDERLGRTVTSVFSLSADPPSILVSIDKTSHLADAIFKRRGFSFAMLSKAQRKIADAFAGKVSAKLRFETGEWERWSSGHPRLGGAAVGMDCRLIGSMELEKHVLFAGGVVDIELDRNSSPLIWHQRQYKSLASE